MREVRSSWREMRSSCVRRILRDHAEKFTGRHVVFMGASNHASSPDHSAPHDRWHCPMRTLAEDLPSYDMGRRPWAPLRPAVLTPWRQHRQRQQRQRHGSQVATTTPCTNDTLPHKCMVRLTPFQTLVQEFLSALRGPPPWDITNVGTMPVAFWLRAVTTWRSEQLADVIRPESHQLPRLYLRTV